MKNHVCRVVVISVLCLGGQVAPAGDLSLEAAKLPRPAANRLPRWRGFNLLEKFHRDWNNRPFVEEDFRLIHELGFNFVRLPMDYRVWIEGNDWERFDEPTLREIDQAVAWGGKHAVHVCINFHRAPGYTVAAPAEPKSLWSDEEARRVCAKHWAMFARRYREIPNERLSFNLFNEPGELEAAAYVRVVREIVAAIRREDPDRLIISDGLRWGTRPVLELAEIKIAQATRGYTPMELTHYKANWVRGADQFPLPAWPIVTACGMLYGSGKPDLQGPLVIDGPFARPARLRLRVGTVSDRGLLIVAADGQTIFQKDFQCGPGQGEWKKAEYRPEWRIYQNLYDRDYEATIPAGTKQLRVDVTEGDWMSLGELGIRADGEPVETVLALRAEWGQRAARLRYRSSGNGTSLTGGQRLDRQWLRETMIRPWQEAESRGIGVMVGEFGVYNHTPHAVCLAWMEDCLKNWKEAGWGWALWNFRGSLGVLDSGRADVVYEDFHGHKLDRKMLDLLQRY